MSVTSTYRLAGAALFAVVAIAFLTPPPDVIAGEPDGQTVFNDGKCNMCHSVPAVGIESKAKSEKMKGPDLPGEAKTEDPDLLAKYLRKQEQINDKDHKKEFTGSDEELKALIGWLQSLD